MADMVETTQTTVPWEAQQPHLKNIFNSAQEQFNAPGPLPFGGQMTAGYSPQERTAQNMTQEFALGDALTQTQNMQNAQQFALGDVLNPQANQALQGHIQAAIQPVREELTEQILPQMNSGAVVAGAFGGDRQGIAQGLAVDKATENMLNTSSQIAGENYRAGLDSFNQALRQAPTTLQTSTVPMQMLSATGELDRNLAQALLNEDIYRWNFAQQQPAAKLAQYQQTVQGNYGGTSTGSIPNQFQQPSDFEQGLGTLTTALGAINTVNDISGGALGDWVSGWF